jgi:hypothetical protein
VYMSYRDVFCVHGVLDVVKVRRRRRSLFWRRRLPTSPSGHTQLGAAFVDECINPRTRTHDAQAV